MCKILLKNKIMSKADRLIDQVALMLQSLTEPPTEEVLRGVIDFIVKAYERVPTPDVSGPFTDNELEQALQTLMARFTTRMSAGTFFQAEDWRPWLAGRQGDINWYYWERYKKHLLTAKGFPIPVVNVLNDITGKILDRLEDPLKDGQWERRGLVVGHVQSGKTANYTGLICKAADAGYQVIIVLAGLLNSLRNQTQERLDTDFMGWCTQRNIFQGASQFDSSRSPRRPFSLTTSREDFKKSNASKAMPLAGMKEPIILVLKKNKSTLENLYKWLTSQNRHDLANYSMLMIDDEADHASVNTNKEDRDPTAINNAIRELLSIFKRSSFVGYTATPFANIFIDPENEDEMKNGEQYKDLFPRNFILSLDPPSNYFGPHRIFAEESDIDCIRFIDDNEDHIPIKHKKDFIPVSLPPSLLNSIDCFILAKAIRLLRGHTGKNHSMMINVTWLNNVQENIKGLVLARITEIRSAIGNFSSLSPDKALQNSHIKRMRQVWLNEYHCCGFEWAKIQSTLKASVDPIEVLGIYSGGDSLDYSKTQYPLGRTVLAVGGHSLSRGLTLEGLVISYFLRNSIMYDTLMQMGRWFGYRDGYEDVCRIFMTDDAFAWYSYIADATEELRRDFRAMERANLTPMDFGLRVRSHPTALIVTARNKMRASRDIPVNISLEGRLAETSVILAKNEIIEANKCVLLKAIKKSQEHTEAEKDNLGWLWRGIPQAVVCNAIEGFQNHPECMLTYAEPLVEYLVWLKTKGIEGCDILLRSVNRGDANEEVCGLPIKCPSRTAASFSDSKIEFSKRRVASKGDESAGLSREQKVSISRMFDGDNLPDREYRKYRMEAGMPPLFMINFVNVSNKQGTEKKIVPCFGISFPGDSCCARGPEKLVQYRVNTVWWERNFSFEEDEEDEE